MVSMDSKKLIEKSVKSEKVLGKHIIIVPKGAEFSMNNEVFKWENNSSDGITITNLPIIEHIEVKIAFDKNAKYG